MVERSRLPDIERMDYLAAALARVSEGLALSPLMPGSMQPLAQQRTGPRSARRHDRSQSDLRWFQDHLTANIGSKTVCVILDIVDLDGEAAVGVLQQAIWNGTAARTL